MAYKMINDRNSGGVFGEEERPYGYTSDFSEAEGLRGDKPRGRGSKKGKTGSPRSPSESDELEEFIW